SAEEGGRGDGGIRGVVAVEGDLAARVRLGRELDDDIYLPALPVPADDPATVPGEPEVGPDPFGGTNLTTGHLGQPRQAGGAGVGRDRAGQGSMSRISSISEVACSTSSLTTTWSKSSGAAANSSSAIRSLAAMSSSAVSARRSRRRRRAEREGGAMKIIIASGMAARTW